MTLYYLLLYKDAAYNQNRVNKVNMMVETKISILNTCKIICKGLSIPPEMAAATFEIYSAPSKVEKVPRLPPFFRTFVFAFCIFASSILTSSNERD